MLEAPLRSRRDCGATAVEMSLVLAIAFMIVAMIVDAGILMHNYGLLTDSSAALSRVVSATFNRETAEAVDCQRLACKARAEIERWTEERGYVRNFKFKPWVTPSNARYAPYPTLRIEASWKNDCIFCTFIPGGLDWHSRSIHVVEYDRTACTSGPEHTCQ